MIVVDIPAQVDVIIQSSKGFRLVLVYIYIHTNSKLNKLIVRFIIHNMIPLKMYVRNKIELHK